MNELKHYTLLNAVTATTTSEPIVIEGARKVVFEFKRANHSAGSTAFKAQVSWDGVTYSDYDMMIDNIANTNSETSARITTKTLSADGTDYAAMDLTHFWFKFVRVVATETT